MNVVTKLVSHLNSRTVLTDALAMLTVTVPEVEKVIKQIMTVLPESLESVPPILILLAAIWYFRVNQKTVLA